MNGIQEMIFVGEITLQAKIVKRAMNQLESAKKNSDEIEIWGSIQSILVATGNISKILWPNKKFEKRGETLRALLNVEKSNILRNRNFRNHFFEHYDERVEEWFERHSYRTYTDFAINPSLTKRGIMNIHRGYNSFNNTLVFRGEILDLNEVLKSISELYTQCKRYGFSW